MNPHPQAIVVGAEVRQASLVVISLHGRFGSGADGVALAQPLMQALLGDAWQTRGCIIAPTAESNKWYPYSFLFPREKNEPAASKSILQVRTLARAVRAQLPQGATLLLTGFSQGACLTCEVLAAEAHGETREARDERLQGVAPGASAPRLFDGAAAFTGGLMGDEHADAASRQIASTPRSHAVLKGLPIALITGDPDGHVPVERVRETASAFKACGASVLLHITQGKRHVVLPEEIVLAADWLRKALPDGMQR